MDYAKIEKWLLERNLVLEECFADTLRSCAVGYKKNKRCYA